MNSHRANSNGYGDKRGASAGTSNGLPINRAMENIVKPEAPKKLDMGNQFHANK